MFSCLCIIYINNLFYIFKNLSVFSLDSNIIRICNDNSVGYV